MKTWQVILGYIRRILNGLNAAGIIPSKKHGLPTDSKKGPHGRQ